MRATFAVAALAGSAIAAPGYGYGHGPKEVTNVHVVVETVVHTVYVTEGYEVPKPTPSPEPVYEPPVVTTVVYEEPAKPSSKYQEPPKPTPTPEAPQPTPETPKPSPSPVAPAPSTPSNAGYMAVVDEYRQKLGLKALTWDAKLEANALDTVVSSKGEMTHKLNPGTFGQVLAEGKPDEFKRVFVGGWLCEIPTLPGITDECGSMSVGWAYNGQTGHAEILTSDKYSKIACAVSDDVWCCDLA